MKYYILVSFFLLFTILLYSQENEKKEFSKNDVTIKLAPLSILNPSMPSIELGASYFLEDNLEIQFKVSKKFDIYNLTDSFKTDGFKIALEYKYYIWKKIYVSIENGYIKNKFSNMMTFYETESSQVEIEDSYVANEKKLFITPKVGYVFFLKDRLIVDFYAGLGVQYHRRLIENLEFDESKGNIDSKLYEYEWFGPSYIEMDDFSERLTLGFNLNYRF